MTEDDTLPPWNGQDLVDLLTLDAEGPWRLRNRFGDPNSHDRAYGGQILAQALMAAARSAPAGRAPTAMQFMFLQGTQHDRPITFDVTALQDGKRFTARHVRGSQAGGRLVLDAQVSFAVALEAPGHERPPLPASLIGEDPERMTRLCDLPVDWAADIGRALGYGLEQKDVIEFRLPEVPERMRLDLQAPRLRFWVRARQALPDDVHLHAAVLAYLSDWWMNFPAHGGHLQLLPPGARLYIASLNHALWFHRPPRADEWLHFDCTGPCSASGRGLAIAHVHDRAGRMVASVTQECLMAQQPG